MLATAALMPSTDGPERASSAFFGIRDRGLRRTVHSTPMRHITAVLRQLGGVADLSALASAGASKRTVQRAAAHGEIVRIRRGWYSLREADIDITRAIRVGGRLACVSACRKYGIWTPTDARTHVSVTAQSNNHKAPDDAHRVRSVGDATVLHWSCRDTAAGARAKVPSVVTALAEAVQCQPAEVGFAMVESALHRGLLSVMARSELYWQVPVRCRSLVSLAGAASGSGTESLFAFRVAALGIQFQQQVSIGGVGQVDFVIGDRLIIEIDSEQHHGGLAQRKRDLARDAVAASLGFITLRFDYWQVMNDWPTVEAAVLASVAQGDHLSRV